VKSECGLDEPRLSFDGMDLIALAIALVTFAALMATIEFLDRV
jgi:hypothetical protein